MTLPRYREYRDSGVDWLGEVPAGWKTQKIRFLFEVKKRIAGEEGYDVLSITQSGIKVKDLDSNDGQLSLDYSKYQIVEVGDFAMNHMDLLTGYVDISNVPGVTSPDYRVFSVRDPAVSYDRYFLYLFQNGYKQRVFFAFGQGSSQLGRWRFPTQEFNEFVFPLPPSSEQAAIAAFLDRETGKIDALVAEQEKLIALLKEKRQAVISHAVTKGLDPDAPMKDSGIEWLGEVPAHWDVTPLARIIVRIEQGWSPNAEDRVPEEDETCVLRLSAVKNGSFDAAESKALLTISDEAKAQRAILRDGDFLITRANTPDLVGDCAIARDLNRQTLFSDLMYRLTPDPNEISATYLLAIFRSEQGRFRIKRDARGSSMSMAKISHGHIKAWMVAVPPINEQSAIMAFLDSETAKLDALTDEAQQAIDLLKERRTALISAAVTGKIDVRGLVDLQEAA